MHWLLYGVARFFSGYAGVFAVSFLGNLIPFMPIPYLAVVYFYSLKVPGASPLVVGIVSGVGGACGKMVVYTLGRGARKLLPRESAQRYERIGKMLRSYGALAAFLISATPSPDDAVIIPLGLMKYDVVKLFLGLAAGKVVISIATAYAGYTVARLSSNELLLEAISSVVLFVIVIVLLVYLDWEKILELIGEKGLNGFLAEVKVNGLSLLVRRQRLRGNG